MTYDIYGATQNEKIKLIYIIFLGGKNKWQKKSRKNGRSIY